MREWLYVLTNESLQGKIKIGFTAKDPRVRCEELYNTSIPTAYKIEYEILVENAQRLEMIVHKKMEHCRVAMNREFFECSPQVAINIVEKVIDEEKIEVLLRYVYCENEMKMNNAGSGESGIPAPFTRFKENRRPTESSKSRTEELRKKLKPRMEELRKKLKQNNPESHTRTKENQGQARPIIQESTPAQGTFIETIKSKIEELRDKLKSN